MIDMVDGVSGKIHLWLGTSQEILDSLATNFDSVTILKLDVDRASGDVMWAVVKFN